MFGSDCGPLLVVTSSDEIARKTDEGFEVTVINGRDARAIKDRRDRSVAELRSPEVLTTGRNLSPKEARSPMRTP